MPQIRVEKIIVIWEEGGPLGLKSEPGGHRPPAPASYARGQYFVKGPGRRIKGRPTERRLSTVIPLPVSVGSGRHFLPFGSYKGQALSQSNQLGNINTNSLA